MRQLSRFGRLFSKRLASVSCYILILFFISLTIANRGLRLNRIEQPTTNSLNETRSFNLASQLNKYEAKNCDQVHLAIVCGGFNSTRDTYVLLKSILFYRTNPIQLHLFVDNISRTIFNELFATWKVPDLFINYYNITNHEHEVSWIPSLHYSHRYGLMKLVFLSILSEANPKMKDLIMLDTDMLVLANINLILKEFNRLKLISNEALIGLVENQSDWYLGDNNLSGSHPVWPAVGRGYNTGLIIVDIVKFRMIDWNQLWRQVAEKHLISHLSTALADQDIINAMIKDQSISIITLPCSFNLQLNDNTKLDKICPTDTNEENVFLVHWNSPYKLKTKNERAGQFNDWYINFRNWNAKLLERKVCHSNDHSMKQSYPDPNTANDENVCSDLKPKFNDSLRTFLYFLPYEVGSSDDFEITAVVHLSIDRFRILNDLAAHWSGPISAAIYLSELETNLFLTSVQYGEHLAQRKNIGYHLVFKDDGFNYPINKLRNIALNNAITPYVFLLDIDFLPSFSLHEYLKNTIKSLANSNEHLMDNGTMDPLYKKALVIPAFESLQYKFEFPLTKADLETQINLGSVSMFREQIWPRGHSPTNYAKWRAATKPYQVDWKPEYEPFIVTSKSVSRFDERFIGFGWNKVEHIMKLAAMDYEFIVMPDAFLIHQFHSASYDIIKHRESHKYRSCIRYLKRKFLVELSVKYPDFFNKLLATSSSAPPNEPPVNGD